MDFGKQGCVMRVNDASYRIKGGRTGVLLIHGLCGSPAEIRYVANGLAREGMTVLCPQLAGHGGSEADLQASTWQDWYRSAEEALFELRATCDRVIIGGLSTGAVLSLMLAARHPEKIDGVTLYSPTLWLSGRKVPWYVPLFRCINSKAIANMFKFPVPMHVGIKDQRIREFVRNATKVGQGAPVQIKTPGGAVLERHRLARVVMGLLGSIRQPVLIMHAREDDYAGLDNANYLQNKLAGPVDLVVLDDCYHMVTVDRQRHIVLDRTSSFIGMISSVLNAGVRNAEAYARFPRVASA
jgi:carboxylesterase